ncbi:hypothetical protein [Nostoc sp. 'Peltigera membranacea cyanobiont' N6]|nr:hypothetical protein [Nostoc sp. 'Peltigera membranacea cyanobiont' N6]
MAQLLTASLNQEQCLPLPQILSGATQIVTGIGRHGASPHRT